MTHDILQSDLDIAKRLILDNRADTEIVSALVLRAVAPAKAAQVVSDLRLGKLVRPADPVFPEFASPSRPRTERRPSSSDSKRKSPPAAKPSGADILSPSGARPRPARRLVTVFVSILGVAAGIGLLYAGRLANQGYHATTADLLTQWESSPTKDEALAARITHRRLNAAETARWNASAPSTEKAADQFLSSASNLVLELQPDGLYIGRNLVTPTNAWRAVSDVLGLPTRTNRTDQPKTVIYAYDHHGLLVYSGEGAGDDAILLDFDALGGTNGTTLPFSGTLKFETNLIHVDTDAGALSSIKKLGLSNPGSDAGTFRGHCNDLDLYFAYLKTPSRLSAIQINLKGPR